MTIYEIKKQLETTVFSHDMLHAILYGNVKNINEKISSMTKKGELLRLKRGLYVLGDEYRDTPINMITIANILYAPSYVSYDYALSYHGLIPERVVEVTSATLGSKKSFDTPVGRFSYKKVPLKAYAIGVDWRYDEKQGGQLIATPEKALCDKVRSDRGTGKMSQSKIADYLEYDLRIEWQDLAALDTELMRKIAMAYNSKLLRDLGSLIAKRKKDV